MVGSDNSTELGMSAAMLGLPTIFGTTSVVSILLLIPTVCLGLQLKPMLTQSCYMCLSRGCPGSIALKFVF